MNARCWLALAATACYTPAPDLGLDPVDDTDMVDGTTPVVPDTDLPPDTDTEPAIDALQVLLLGDGVSDNAVAAALTEHGFNVIQVGTYQNWTGSNPPLDDIDVVFFMQAAVWEAELSEEADVALVTHLARGGGLVRTERAVFAAHDSTDMQVDFGLPVQYNFNQETAVDWWAVDRTHDLLRSLPGLWTEEATITHVTPRDSNTTVVAATQRDIPLLSYQENNGGVYLHLNHDVTATSPTLSVEFKTLLGNVVEFAAP